MRGPRVGAGDRGDQSGKGKGRSPLVLLGSGPGLWGRLLFRGLQ
jgi:hypothetical protein